jgi:hypothetical protein
MWQRVNIDYAGVHVVDAAGDFDSSCRCTRSRRFRSRNRHCSRGNQHSDKRILDRLQISLSIFSS